MNCEQRDDGSVDISRGQVELADYRPSVDVVLTPGGHAGRPESWTFTALATDLGSGTGR